MHDEGSAGDGSTVPVRWSAVIPVKLLHSAKTRITGIDPGIRRRLALAMALDTIGATLACPSVGQVVVVTDDEEARSAARGAGADVVPDEPDAGLNSALVFGAERARATRADDGVVALAADLPALHPDALRDVLVSAGAHARAVVGDTAGVGTVLLTARAGVPLDPAYGPGSLQRHRASGAVELEVDDPGVRRDVDTVGDLVAALRLGCGPRTSAIAAAVVADRPH